MHEIQHKIYELAGRENLALLTLRGIAQKIGMPAEPPQKIKHHLLQLQKKGFLGLDKVRGIMHKQSDGPSWAVGLLKKAKRLFSIPVVGTANCGPARIFAEQNFQGFLRVSNKLINRSKPDGLFAVKADGSSMNRADIDGRNIEDGDFAIVDRNDKSTDDGSIVLTIIDNKATIKRLIRDEKNNQIVLKADSSYDYDPIYLHPDDDFVISGRIVAVVKKPNA